MIKLKHFVRGINKDKGTLYPEAWHESVCRRKVDFRLPFAYIPSRTCHHAFPARGFRKSLRKGYLGHVATKSLASALGRPNSSQYYLNKILFPEQQYKI